MGTFHASVTFRNRIYMIHIACNIDHQFIQHCAVTLVSLFINNPGQVFCVHIVAGSLPQEDQDLLTKLAASYGHTVRFYFPPADLLKNYSIKKFGQRISMATYYRCMFPSILPETVDKVLYLDCDIVIRGDISAFWNTDLEGYGVACIEDIGSQEKERYELLHYDPADSYFNAGVLLINLRYWRETHVDHQCETYFLTYPERIRFNDQDLLNVVLHAHKKLFPSPGTCKTASTGQASGSGSTTGKRSGRNCSTPSSCIIRIKNHGITTACIRSEQNISYIWIKLHGKDGGRRIRSKPGSNGSSSCYPMP